MSNLRDQLQATLSGTHTLERELGGGGMSKVFVAEETRLGRKVVVKVLSPELAQGISVERFEREIKTAAALQQANIVPVLSAGDTNGLPFYTMPFVTGESLRARLGRGPLAINEVVNILRDVARALAFAHRQGVVHRDIKPDNVLLSEGAAVVTDFGIAKAISAARTSGAGATLTQVGTSIGTPAYMAPEQAAGDPEIDHRADIYSLGAMAYELLTGHVVFANRTPQRMLAAHMSEAPVPVTDLRPDTPLPLADLVMACLAKDAMDRPQDATQVVNALETTSGGSMPAMPAILLGGKGMFRKALAIYAAAFVVVAIVAKAAIVGIGLPDWVFPGSLIVMALGLPVILWTGYVHRVARRAATATPTFTPGGTPSTTAHGTIATMALKAAPHVSWYRTARGGMYAFGAFIAVIAAFMGMRAFGIGPFGSLLATGALSQRERAVLADFRTTNTDSTLGRVVSDAVRAGLSGSSAFTLASPGELVAALERMRQPKTTRIDADVARQIALREGIKAVVDGEVTGVEGGYIVTLRLVRADSGVELASFRETGDGPRGLIDAADKLARALRSKAGESLRAVNATPPLFQATTSSLEALRKYSEATRANALGDRRSIDLNREAVALDSTFATAWNGLAATLSNYGAPQSAIDSAMRQAYRYRDKLPERERNLIVGRYYSLGPGRDRAKAIAAYEALVQRGDSTSAAVNLGESLRSRREFARAESLNLASARQHAANGTALGNAIEMQLNQGNVQAAAATNARLASVSPGYWLSRQAFILWAAGDDRGLGRLIDSVKKAGGANTALSPVPFVEASLALKAGRLHDAADAGKFRAGVVAGGPIGEFYHSAIQLQVLGPTPAVQAKLQAAIAAIPFRDLPVVDRPYLDAASALAFAGDAEKAKAMLARYRSEVTDTSLLRVEQPAVHDVLAEIALAERRPRDAIAEFRKGDVGPDGAPAGECAPCLPFNLARAFDAAGMPDSAIVMYEKYLATPFWLKATAELDPVRVPAIRERLGQLYEAAGNTAKAAEHYRAFIELWKNADPELQPRVQAARARLAKLSAVEGSRR
ncbi:MAG: protein kinase [Gemmatimonadota bacterium]|nr:protein kinase [Gemmatimonadota bacterium]